MSVVVRGAKNAFRNWLRTGAVVVILAIGIGLSLSMLVARQAVEGRIAELKEKMGTMLIVNPAGSRGFEGGGEPLTTDQVGAVKSVAHVTSAEAVMGFMLRNENEADGGDFMLRTPSGTSSSATAGKTNLQSSIETGTLGRRFSGATGSNAAPPSPPIRGIGTNGNVGDDGVALVITEGRGLTSSDTTSALVGKDLAIKNNLKIGSTFTAYNTTFTVVGIFDQGTKFANNTLAIPLAKAQELTGQTKEVGAIIVKVDSIENLASTTQAIKDKLGSNKADVSQPGEDIQTAIDGLRSVQGVALIGFVASLAAAAVITFLIMTVIVRERRREIGVLKAIGASNRSIVSQFIVEAVVLVAMGAVVGVGVALVGSNGIANALVKSNSADSSGSQASSSPGRMEAGPMGGGMLKLDRHGLQDTGELVGSVTTSVGPLTLLWGLLAAVGIAIVGSAVPAWFIAKVRPAIVLRGE
ncbi:MAG TPA: FtsX-like permease family protein [Candidatus Saccharimonadales bacterium]|nr:FtsX-like permease family protein [Candidatus Saccharimonadales bacterium]